MGPVSCPTGSPWPLRVKYSTALSHDAYIVISNTGKCLCFHRGSKSSTMVRLQGNVGALRRGAEEGPGLRPTPPSLSKRRGAPTNPRGQIPGGQFTASQTAGHELRP